VRNSIIVAVAAVVIGAASLQAQQGSQQAPPPKPEQKTDAKTPTTVAGKWNLAIDGPQGSMMALLEMKADEKDAKKVTGTLSSDMGQSAVAGEFAEGKLTFSLTFDGGGGSMELWFSGAMKDDGTMTGTIDTPQGEIPWHAERVKDK
jgi:hypothetical protein